ncbi:hypothetical protein M2152_002598 [Microbacteriaceae bacterium SG_E_30_P1]|uniref:Uncharacterized protein n=1 Tax=Antiquaquibacter oligotrophicus TaxID=2880260 RepID=A0ABT6KR10_9MICO|nr:hypothetical protein [Antiquaquibacter oligotrophicus]MDH6182416.1 hypothetical protein [Antiquaquibacter oligotrophicus]UDF14612.1 hypothetical protein LH407_07055 [Antiquaquibacter oligotrophicus]
MSTTIMNAGPEYWLVAERPDPDVEAEKAKEKDDDSEGWAPPIVGDGDDPRLTEK